MNGFSFVIIRVNFQFPFTFRRCHQESSEYKNEAHGVLTPLNYMRFVSA